MRILAGVWKFQEGRDLNRPGSIRGQQSRHAVPVRYDTRREPATLSAYDPPDWLGT